MNGDATIAPSAHVRLHLSITLADGTEALSTFDADPLELTIGDGTLTPSLEQCLIGLGPGEDHQILASGNDIYGPHDPNKVHRIDRGDLPDDFEPAAGQVLTFSAPGGQETPATLIAVEEDAVEVDFNHPLSGKSLSLIVRVLDVASAAAVR